MTKLLYFVLRYPGCAVLVTAPMFDQVKWIAFKHLTDHLHRLKQVNPRLFSDLVGSKGLMKTMIRFKNGSVILAESPVPETIGGYSAKVVYLMEMNFIRDDEYLIAESMPWNIDSVFHDMFHKPEYGRFSRHGLPYTEALPPNGPLTPSIVEMIEEQLKQSNQIWKWSKPSNYLERTQSLDETWRQQGPSSWERNRTLDKGLKYL